MKKFKSIIAVFLSMIIVGSLAASLSASAAAEKRKMLGASVESQSTHYYCGVCALQALLHNEIRRQPSKLKSDVRGDRNGYIPQKIYDGRIDVTDIIRKYGAYDVDSWGQTAWFVSGGSNKPSDRSLNPLCCTLQRATELTWNLLGPYTENYPFIDRVIRSKITTSIDMGHCVLVNGDTLGKSFNVYPVRTNTADRLNRPASYPWTDGHWVVIDGYDNYGNVLRVLDSGYNGTGCSGFPSNCYYIRLEDLKTFINGSHGIIFCEKNSK